MLKSNNMKKILFAGLLFLAGCVPVRYVYVDPKDSVVRQQRIIRDYQYIQTPMYMDWYYRPYYSPRIVIPIRPNYGPLPPTPRPRH